MTIFTKRESLNDAELNRLGAFLRGCKGGRAMNLEELDGFFAALIAGRNRDAERIQPGGLRRRDVGCCEFSSLEEANEIFGLMMRHWNAIAGTLFNGEVYVRSCWRTNTRGARQRLGPRLHAGHAHAPRWLG